MAAPEPTQAVLLRLRCYDHYGIIAYHGSSLRTWTLYIGILIGSVIAFDCDPACIWTLLLSAPRGLLLLPLWT